MAKVEFEAFIEDVLSGQSGVFGLKTAEPHSKKDEGGRWQTVARTFRTVKASRDSGVSFVGFAKGDKVTITGSEKTEVREWQGKKLYDLVVWADSVSPVNRPGAAAAAPAGPQSWDTTPVGGEQYGDNTPF